MPNSPEEAALKIIIDGQDMTDRWHPFLIQVSVVDKDDEIDTCRVELDDTHGQLKVPDNSAPIIIAMGWKSEGLQFTFNGLVSDVESAGDRRGGRILIVEGKSADLLGGARDQLRSEWGEGEPPGGGGKQIPLSQVLTESAGKAGYSISVAPEFASKMRPYWAQNGESFLSFGQRLAKEMGGSFKVVGGHQASFTSATSSMNAAGEALATVAALAGEGGTMIQWRIKPIASRPMIGETRGEHFDKQESRWIEKVKAVGGGWNSSARHLGRFTKAGEPDAEQENGGPAADSERRRGIGWVVIDGNPAARAGGTCTVQGARPGVDGSYRITEAEHAWSRGTGYQTRLDLEQPQSGAGVDSRVAPEWQAPG